MASKTTKDFKLIKDREKIYREVATLPRDLYTLRAFMVKKNLVESGNKFDKAFEELKSSGRIIVNKGYVMAEPSKIKKGIFVASGKMKFVVLEGEEIRRKLSKEEGKGYRTNERINIGFSEYGNETRPFIISRYESKEKSFVDLLPKLENDVVVGRVVKISHDELAFIPIDKKYKKNVVIANSKESISKFQDKICMMKITSDEKPGVPACGILTKILGDAGNPIHEYEAIASANGAIMSWSDEKYKEEISNIPSEVDLTDKTLISEEGDILQRGGERIYDLRNLAFTTVDPATCKDMDDAIYSTFDEDGHLVVYTAVANVTKYVDINSEIGKTYIEGGFTVYAPNRAYNILPPELSTGICSLNPNVDRLALVIKTVVNEKTGVPISSTFMDAVIESKHKYSYPEAQEICDNNPISTQKLKEKLKNEGLSQEEQVILNQRASQILWKGFDKRDIIKFETKDEYDMIFNEDFSDIVDILPQENCDYHKVIESFMLTANEASAQFAKDNGLPNIYRVHEMPNEERTAQAEEFFRGLNIPFDGDLSPKGLQKIIKAVAGTNKEKMVNNFLVRLQNRAKYSCSTNPKTGRETANNKFLGKNGKVVKENKEIEKYLKNTISQDEVSHFGLQSMAYSQTTSPIRRIVDYVTHYNILAKLKGNEPIDLKTTMEIVNWANLKQESEKLAEREFQEISSVIYCESHLGEVMRGYVSGFKRKYDGESNSAENFVVIVENEEKGIKVEVPLNEVLRKNQKNIGISPFGVAIIDKNNSKPLLRLCEYVDFKIVSANRLTKEIIATGDIHRFVSNQFDNDIELGEGTQALNPEKTPSQKKQKMLKEVEYKKANKSISAEESKRVKTERKETARFKNEKRKQSAKPIDFEEINEKY